MIIKHSSILKDSTKYVCDRYHFQLEKNKEEKINPKRQQKASKSTFMLSRQHKQFFFLSKIVALVAERVCYPACKRQCVLQGRNEWWSTQGVEKGLERWGGERAKQGNTQNSTTPGRNWVRGKNMCRHVIRVYFLNLKYSRVCGLPNTMFTKSSGEIISMSSCTSSAKSPRHRFLSSCLWFQSLLHRLRDNLSLTI